MRIFLDTVGCRLNQAEIESLALEFRAAGHEIVASAHGADLTVVNTCSVTAAAASDSRTKIRHLARIGPAPVVVTGCWATLQPERALELPRVLRVVPNDRKSLLVNEHLRPVAHDVAPERPGRIPLPGARRRTRAFIKAQDGCNNRCTFCITTVARGRSRSRGVREVVADVQTALRGGSKEIVLTGVHLGCWGEAFDQRLSDLVRAILSDTDVPRIRLSSLEPWDLDETFFRLWEDRRLCPHLHLPLQSGCSTTLRRMARKATPASFRALVGAARSMIPDAAITTDIIAGFPGETTAEFEASLDFVAEMDFAGGHAFSYSPMQGTAAARMPAQVAPEERRRRTNRYREIFEESAARFALRHVGQLRSVLWETEALNSPDRWELSGLTDNYLRVRSSSAASRWNEIDYVHLVGTGDHGMLGIIAK